MGGEAALRLARLVLATAASAALACGTDIAAPILGTLELSVSGLPGGVPAALLVTGPEGFSSRPTGTDTLEALPPGTYTIDAAVVIRAGTAHTPAPLTQTVSIAAGAVAQASVAYAPATFSLAAQHVVGVLSNPVYVTAPRNDPRLFVVEQPGRIRVIKDGLLLPVPFLDISERVTFGGERGLLSMAFDPGYATNGRFYIYYTGSLGDIFVDRHTASPGADVANPEFQQVITIQHRLAANHNGGLALFGPDGMLYLGTGDGGGAGDPQGNGQNTSSLLGKLLRIDVSSLPYTIPAGNPFLGQAGADEVWAYGLRNPWRFAFDGSGGAAQLYIADVGQNAWEEVNFASASAAGLNYGWRIMEGGHCFNPSSGCVQTGLTLPVHEYDHAAGCSIVGGFVYRGSAIPELRGHYFYSDYCSGGLRSFRVSGNAAVDHVSWPISVGGINSFGVDGVGELYVVSAGGRVYRIVKE